MSLQALVWALRVPCTKTVGDPAIRTLCILADYASDEYLAWPSEATLCEDRGISRATMYRHLKQLHEAGLIIPGPSHVVAHIPANRRPNVWLLNAYSRGLNSETPDDPRGLTPQGAGVSSGETAIEEPRTSIETKTHTSPARTRVQRSSSLVEFPDRECTHGEPAVMWTNPKNGRRAPRCPLCRHFGSIILDPIEVPGA